MPATEPTYLFLHLMKTGGTSFLAHLADNFPPGSLYPDDRIDPNPADELRYGSLGKLRALTSDQRAAIRVYTGHLPFLAREVVDPDVTITILRDPVERAVSALRQIQAARPDGRSLEEIYDNDPKRWMIIQDYQSRQFALTADELEEAGALIDSFFPDLDTPATDVPHFVYVPLDDRRLERAIDHASSVEVVGLQSDYDGFLDELQDRFGWQLGTRHQRRVAKARDEVSESFRRRIADDNAYDVEFYARMAETVRKRRSRSVIS